MSQSYLQAISVEELINQGIGVSHYAETDSSYLDFNRVTSAELNENYFNVSPYLSYAVYNNIIDKLNDCINIVTPIDNYDDILGQDVNTGEYNYYKYNNSVYSKDAEGSLYNNVDNKYLLKFEDIICKDKNNLNVTLDSDTNISSFIKTVSSDNPYFTNMSDFNGAFFYVDLDTMSQVATDESNMLIQAGESIEIPVTFEYFIDQNSFERQNIKKTLIFAIKDSLYQDEKYYEIELSCNMNSLSANSIYTSSNTIDLSNNLDGDLLS